MLSTRRRRRSSEPSPLSFQTLEKYREYISDSDTSSIMSNQQSFPSPPNHHMHPTKPHMQNSQIAYGTGMIPTNFSTPASMASLPLPSQTFMPQSSLSDFDIQRLATAVKNMMSSEITNMIKDTLNKEIRQLVDVHVAKETASMQQTMETLASKNKELERRVDELEAYSRKNLIRISGVGEEEKETGEALIKIADKLNIPITASDIEVSHRVGPVNSSRPSQIIARIKNNDLRHRLLKNNKKLRSVSGMTGIHINQELSKARGKLAYHARQLLREKKIKSTFVWDGRVIIVDHNDAKHTIQSVDDIMNTVD
ncbi:hypothetical protein FSP39_002908 [Pinctada imbricata]|uniref:Uncharacterized protein n=1 Tax=Pinctada imbricata TaxID=66713 RepID=A0AA88XVF8_PINIB|nr:hypothetical protein FSP39_002908 [Pinctada imbricata]